MPLGIKLSNQLYPATGDQILSLAEYIHDSEWDQDKKDLQSINATLKENDLLVLKNGLRGENGVNVENSDASITYNNQGLGSILNTPTVKLVNTLAVQYLELNEDYLYNLCTVGRLIGDFNGDGSVDINDITLLIDKVLGKIDTLDPREFKLYFYVKNNGFYSSLQNFFGISDTLLNTKLYVKFDSLTNNNNSNSLNINQSDSHIEIYTKINNYLLKETVNTIMASSIGNTLKSIYNISKIYYDGGVVYDKTINKNYICLIKCFYNENEDDIISELYLTNSLEETNLTLTNDLFELRVEDPDNFLGADTNLNYAIDINDVTNLIDYVLRGEFTIYTDLFNSSGEINLLEIENGTLSGINLKTCPGLIYLVKDNNNRTIYYTGSNINGYELIPIRITNDNLTAEVLDSLLESVILNILEPPRESSSDIVDNLKTAFNSDFLRPLDTIKQLVEPTKVVIHDSEKYCIKLSIFINNTIEDSNIENRLKLKLYFDEDSSLQLYNNNSKTVVQLMYISKPVPFFADGNIVPNVYRFNVYCILNDESLLSKHVTIGNISYNELADYVQLHTDVIVDNNYIGILDDLNVNILVELE